MARWRSAVGWVGVTAIALAWFAWLRPIGLGGPATLIRVTGVSMEPTFSDGDLVLVHREVDYEVGEVVAFEVPEGRVIHRIVGGDGQDGFLLQGDNRDEVDQWRPRDAAVIGREVLHLPGLGRALPALNSVVGRVVMLALAAWLLLRPESTSRGRRRRHAPVPSDGESRQSLPRALYVGGSATVVCVVGVGLATSAVAGGTRTTTSREVVARTHDLDVQIAGRRASTFAQPTPVFGPLPLAEALDEPLFTQTLESLDVILTYEAGGMDVAPDVGGSHRVVLVVSAPEGGWVRRLEVVPHTVFRGSGFSTTVPLRLGELQGVLERAQADLGVAERTFELHVEPQVRLAGSPTTWTADGVRLQLTPQQIEVLPDQGANRLAETRDVDVVAIRQVAGLPWPVALVVGVLLAAAAGWVASRRLRDLWRLPEVRRFLRGERDGDGMAPVAARSPVRPAGTVVDVVDLPSLLRTAHQLQLPVVVEEDGGARRHWVFDGAVAYRLVHDAAGPSPGAAGAARHGALHGTEEAVAVIDLTDGPGHDRNFPGASPIHYTAP